MAKRKSKKEGRYLKTLPPMSKVAPYIMAERNDALNYIADTVDVEAAEEYIFKKRSEGLKGFGMMHVMIASYIRTVSQRPGLNRFIRGQKIYARNFIEIMITVKKEMNLESPDTVLKIIFEPDATADDVYRIMTDEIEKARSEESDFDNTAKILNYIPGLVLKFSVWVLKCMDYFGLLPRKLTKLSPFHGSFGITSMASLGIPPIYHHIYNFGNIPLFLAFGPKKTLNVLQRDGTVKQKRFVEYKFTTDERICDGYYYASALKMMKSIVLKPEQLDNPPEQVFEDIE